MAELPHTDFGTYADPLADPRRPAPGQVSESIETIRQRQALQRHAARHRASTLFSWKRALLLAVLLFVVVPVLGFLVSPLLAALVVVLVLLAVMVNFFRE